ncbi:hypothetical protein A6V39_03380 [Candidatus Mycoplasma haematobovis]|uniref:Uncharacterized protein n=1 Tax=Candidatus Mycoplasma haematobovis TaxID=432608 RepID=A0A1A9QBT4_9MOLU|nr:hypothetical protein [Candidatus Mycoplasma haematobovis]OAL09927.1 hypothetical protein A6V39_03380 [Candidatus Mycoplasma haematobovis]
MSLSVTNKAIIGALSATALGGLAYGAYSQFSAVESVKDTLIKKLKNPLNLTETQGEDVEHLKELAKQYHSGKPTGKDKIDGLVLRSESDTAALKAKCEILLNTNKKDSNYDRSLKDAENWCTREGAPRKISDLLAKNNKVLLTDRDNTEWNKPWETFKSKYQTKDPVAPWDFSNWSSLKSNPTAEKAFKDKCTENGTGSIMLSEEKLLSEIEEYCTKPKS